MTKKANDNAREAHILGFFQPYRRSSSGVEQRIRNAWVAGSIPAFGSTQSDMSDQPPRGRGSRARRAEEFWNRITLLVGCGAVVGIVAAVIVVISQQVMRPPMVDEEYVAASFHQEQPNPTWSGVAKSDAALLNAASKTKPTEPVPAATAVSLSDIPQAEPVVAGIENIDSKRELISQALERFFKAESPDQRLPLVRDVERVKPLMMSYYSREPMPALRWRGVGRMVRVDEPGYRFGYVQALFEDAKPTNVIVEETDDGRYLVDWECFVRYGEVAWSDFLRMKPVEPKLLRVIASKPATAPSMSTGKSEWLELRHPAESGTVLGYFDRNDPQLATLVQQLEQGQWKDVPVTLRLCFPADAAAPQRSGAGVQIAGIEGKGWLILRSDARL